LTSISLRIYKPSFMRLFALCLTIASAYSMRVHQARAGLGPANQARAGLGPVRVGLNPANPERAAGTRSRGVRMLAEMFVADPSYNLAAGAAVLGTICGGLEDLRTGDLGKKLPTAPLFGGAAVLLTVFGAFLAFQTTTLRFTFDETAFALVKADLSTTGENVVVGGENRWKYDTFVNWTFLPSEDFPILVYFRETQTPAASREEVPIVVDEADGQVHFFPAISNSQQLKAQFVARGCAKL